MYVDTNSPNIVDVTNDVSKIKIIKTDTDLLLNLGNIQQKIILLCL